MKALKTLVKLHKYQLDKLLEELHKIELRRHKAMLELRRLEEEAHEEVKSFIHSEYSFALDAYLTNSKNKQGECNRNIKIFDKETEKLKQETYDKFTEFKKIEIILKKKKEYLKYLAFKKELSVQEEINTIKYNYTKLGFK